MLKIEQLNQYYGQSQALWDLDLDVPEGECTVLMGRNGVGKTSILEAIAYGLTGEPSTVQDRTKLLRDPNKPASVCLRFTIDDKAYQVERSQSDKRALKASLVPVGERKRLASNGTRPATMPTTPHSNSSRPARRAAGDAEGRGMAEHSGWCGNGQPLGTSIALAVAAVNPPFIRLCA